MTAAICKYVRQWVDDYGSDLYLAVAMTPEEKFTLLKTLLERGAEVKTYYRGRRVVALERGDSQVVIRYEDGGVDKMHIRDFCRRRFVVVL